MMDEITAPRHYAGDGEVDCKRACRSMVTGSDLPPMVNHWWLSAMEYLWRWPWKNGLQDLRKAKQEIDYMIEELEGGDEWTE